MAPASELIGLCVLKNCFATLVVDCKLCVKMIRALKKIIEQSFY